MCGLMLRMCVQNTCSGRFDTWPFCFQATSCVAKTPVDLPFSFLTLTRSQFLNLQTPYLTRMWVTRHWTTSDHPFVLFKGCSNMKTKPRSVMRILLISSSLQQRASHGGERDLRLRWQLAKTLWSGKHPPPPGVTLNAHWNSIAKRVMNLHHFRAHSQWAGN